MCEEAKSVRRICVNIISGGNKPRLSNIWMFWKENLTKWNAVSLSYQGHTAFDFLLYITWRTYVGI